MPMRSGDGRHAVRSRSSPVHQGPHCFMWPACAGCHGAGKGLRLVPPGFDPFLANMRVLRRQGRALMVACIPPVAWIRSPGCWSTALPLRMPFRALIRDM